MFNFFKKIFTKQLEKEEIKLEELENWFNEKTKDKIEVLKLEIKTLFSRMEEEKEKLKQNIDILQKAELHNPRISVKEVQFMEGNREAYLKKLNLFLEKIDINKNPRPVLEFCSVFEESIDVFAKSTLKSNYIIKEFFSDYISGINQNIKNIDKIEKNIRALTQEKEIQLIEDTKKEINDLKNKIELKEKLKNKSLEEGKNLEEAEKQKKKIDGKLEEAMSGNEFLSLKKLEEGHDKINKQIAELKEPFLHNFSVIDAALKKYERMSLDERIVHSYLANPVKALLNDKEFKIIEILEKTKENILNNSIELKDKKRDKILEKIPELDKTYFKEFLSQYTELDNKRDELQKNIEKNPIKSDLKKLNNELNMLTEKINNTRNNIEKFNSEKDKIDIEKLKENLQHALKEALKKEIAIT